jgi:hypothetical protein
VQNLEDGFGFSQLGFETSGIAFCRKVMPELPWCFGCGFVHRKRIVGVSEDSLSLPSRLKPLSQPRLYELVKDEMLMHNANITVLTDRTSWMTARDGT